jgi:hypothetical protein
MNNFIILSGDSIIDFKINSFMDTHLLQNSLISLLLLKDEQKFINQKLKHLNSETEINIFGVHSKNTKNPYKQLVYHSMIYDDPQNEERIKFSKKLLDNCSDFDLIYNYDDVHLYMFNKKIYNLLEDEKISKLGLIKSDLIPFLINRQFNKRLRNLISVDGNKQYIRDSIIGTNAIQIKVQLVEFKIMCWMLEGKNYV